MEAFIDLVADDANLPDYVLSVYVTRLLLIAGQAFTDGRLGSLSPRALARQLRYPGKPDVLYSALLESGWLELHEGELHIHDWGDYGGRVLAERERWQQTKREQRESKKSQPSPRDIPEPSGGQNEDGSELSPGQFEDNSETSSGCPPDVLEMSPLEAEAEAEAKKQQQQTQVPILQPRAGPTPSPDPHASPPAAGCLLLPEACALGEQAFATPCPSGVQGKLRELASSRGGVPDALWREALDYTRQQGHVRSPWAFAVKRLQERAASPSGAQAPMPLRLEQPKNLGCEQTELHLLSSKSGLDAGKPSLGQTEALLPWLGRKAELEAAMERYAGEVPDGERDWRGFIHSLADGAMLESAQDAAPGAQKNSILRRSGQTDMRTRVAYENAPTGVSEAHGPEPPEGGIWASSMAAGGRR
jgi:hypothetical protein